MKITTARIKEIIREEYARLNENYDPHGEAFAYDIETFDLQDLVNDHGDVISKSWRGDEIVFEFEDGTEYSPSQSHETDYTPGREGRYYRNRYRE